MTPEILACSVMSPKAAAWVLAGSFLACIVCWNRVRNFLGDLVNKDSEIEASPERRRQVTERKRLAARDLEKRQNRKQQVYGWTNWDADDDDGPDYGEEND